MMTCIHGMEEKSWCAYCRQKNINKDSIKSKSKRNPRTNASSKKKLCSNCRKEPIFKRSTNKCLKCFKKSGQRICLNCKKAFTPKMKSSRKCGCKLPRKKGRGSVWIVASAGLPSLGKKK